MSGGVTRLLATRREVLYAARQYPAKRRELLDAARKSKRTGGQYGVFFRKADGEEIGLEVHLARNREPRRRKGDVKKSERRRI